MKIVELALPVALLDLSDEMLGAQVRTRMSVALHAAKGRKRAGNSAIREKLGTPITIDGVDYKSRRQAMNALGMTFAAFAKAYPNDGAPTPTATPAR